MAAYSDNLEISLAAAEYVLGTLEPLEAERFEAELSDNELARRELAYWEQRLGALALALAPEPPPASVWENILAEIRGRQSGPGPDAAPNTVPFAPRRRSRIGLWRGLAIAASVAALVMAALLFSGVGVRPSSSGSEPAYASVIYDKPTGMSWLITGQAGSRQLSVVAMGNFNISNGKMLRAWVKPANGKPVLLGQFPHTQGQHEITVSRQAERSMSHAEAIMVTLEDASHRNNPNPSGKVMWKVPVAHRES